MEFFKGGIRFGEPSQHRGGVASRTILESEAMYQWEAVHECRELVDRGEGDVFELQRAHIPHHRYVGDDKARIDPVEGEIRDVWERPEGVQGFICGGHTRPVTTETDDLDRSIKGRVRMV